MFAADARKHTPGKNAEKENFSMRILVCDDDAAFAGQLAEKIEAIVKPQMPRSTVDCATDAALLRALPLAKYDLAFLDIDMGPLNGVDLARRLHELRPDMLLIFVTNYVEYSLQGYEVQAFRYLLKAEMPQKLERYVQQALTAYRKTRDTVRIFCDGISIYIWRGRGCRGAAAADLVRRDVGPQGMPAPAGGRPGLVVHDRYHGRFG